MFAVHSFATHSSAAAFKPALRRPTPVGATHRGSLQIVSGTISTNDFKIGVNVEVNNAPWKVVEFMHVKPGKGSAFVRSKLKNYLTKSTNEITFRAGEKLQTADVEKRTMQYTYKDGEQFVFMDMETYEETRVDDDEFSKFLMEGTICEVLSWNGRVIGVDLPINVELEVKMTDPGIKGNTVSGGDKPAEVMTGAMVTVPLFIQIGEKIVVDTTSGKYVKRAKE
mmetsp:Transcript_13279/g.49659  ORF Transcript_13279/g.49659 Transcript_13279/m.49659 type:complete len:224 (+) Transcript_13279:56-727(+)